MKRCRMPEEISLNLVDARGLHEIQLLLGFHALGGCYNPESVRESLDCVNRCGTVAALRRSLCERLVNLDLVEREAHEVAHRRIARSEIVKHDCYAKVLDLADRGKVRRVLLEQGRLGDLQLKAVRRQAALNECAKHNVQHVS